MELIYLKKKTFLNEVFNLQTNEFHLLIAHKKYETLTELMTKLKQLTKRKLIVAGLRGNPGT